MDKLAEPKKIFEAWTDGEKLFITSSKKVTDSDLKIFVEEILEQLREKELITAFEHGKNDMKKKDFMKYLEGLFLWKDYPVNHATLEYQGTKDIIVFS